MRREYASKLTKEMLEKSGITNITKEGKIFKYDKPCAEFTYKGEKKKYYKIIIYDFDENGNKIKVYDESRGKGWYSYKQRLVGVHRAVYAWFYGEVPEGYVVDHIDNNCLNNNLNNLQLLTQAENLAKDRKESVYKIKMRRKGYTEAEILDKIDYYTALYNMAKAEKNPDKCHKLRGNIAQWKNRYKQWKENNYGAEIQNS